ncbi:MAG: hypothetical protein ABIZ81_08160 [Opitutaceae bacterium]
MHDRLLELKSHAEFLRGRLALYWTGTPHDTPDLARLPRDYDAIERAGMTAREAVWRSDLTLLADAVRQSYFKVQRAEGMPPLPGDPEAPAETRSALPPGIAPLAWKYCGGGFGGYAVYLFADNAQRDATCAQPHFRPIEPYLAAH